jgi:hypothetical protein
MHVGCAIDLPKPRVELELGRRRHRRITGPAGLLLFACMFLPAVKGCSAPVYPIETPMFLPPYLFGLVFAGAAATFTARGMRRAIGGLRVVTIASILGATVTMLLAPPIGVVELFASVAVLATIGWSGHSERRAAVASLIISTLCTLWFGLWATTAEALLGVYLAAAASGALLVGSCLWLGEAIAAKRPISLPRAVVAATRR